MRTLIKEVVFSLFIGILVGILILKVLGLENVDIRRVVNGFLNSSPKEKRVITDNTNLPVRQFKI